MKSKVVVHKIYRKILVKIFFLLNSFIFGIEMVYKDVEHCTFITIQSTTIIYSTIQKKWHLR